MSEDKEIRKAVGRYLEKVAAELGDMRSDEKDTILQGIESHVYDTLAARSKGSPTVADLELVLAEMSPPSSYAPAPKSDARAEAPPPRMSALPVIAVFLAPFGFLACYLSMHVVQVPAGQDPFSPAYIIFARFFLLPLGVASPFLTPALGFMGISRIRAARGRLSGLALSVFASVIYPLVLLDGFIVYIMVWATPAIIHELKDGWPIILTIVIATCVTLVSVVWLSIWIPRALWRWASRPLAQGELT